jgi:cell division protein FtsI/penicillin-binding protein 2
MSYFSSSIRTVVRAIFMLVIFLGSLIITLFLYLFLRRKFKQFKKKRSKGNKSKKTKYKGNERGKTYDVEAEVVKED